MTENDLKIAEEINNKIKDNPNVIPLVLSYISQNLDLYMENCKKQNDGLLREALGDAVHVIGMKRKPAEKELPKYLERVKKAIFPDGITEYHHQGEKNFFNKMRW